MLLFGNNPLIKSKFLKKDLAIKTATLVAAGMIFVAAVLLLWVSSWRIPTLDSFEERRVTQSTKIYDRTGEVLLYDVFQNIKRTVVPFEDISENIKEAVMAIEDIDFYNHNGIKITSIIRAVLANITGLSYNQGGSTITQQVLKNSILTGEKRVSRKLKEWVLAPKLEKILTKDEIFSMYLNETPFGGSLYGVEEASNAFFGKSAKDITLTEAAYLASLLQAPSFYSPYGRNRSALEDRKNLVLREMFENGFIDQAEYDSAVAENIEFKPQEAYGIKAPHFVIYVKDELEKKYGDKVLEEGGLRIITTLDYNLQQVAEREAITQALQNKENFNAENVGLIAVAPKNGDILAMVGSRNYFDNDIDGNFNITTAHRQPGSAFKPFAYAQAFIKGYTPETVIFDVRTQFSTTCTADGQPLSGSGAQCYTPENYDLRFRGPVSMRDALAQSINIPAIKTLYLAGMRETLELAKNMGIRSLTNINQYGLTLVLGGGEVSLLDLTSAYGVFANEGVKNQPRAILEVRNQSGDVIEKAEERPIQIIDRRVANQISDILSDENARAPAFGFGSPLNFPGRDVAVKTGTTNDYRDAIIVGYTPDIAIGAWAGNNNNTPMERRVAAFIIAPFWNRVMNEALKAVPDTKFNRPVPETSYDLKPILRGRWQGGNPVLIDKISGKLATEYTPNEALDEILTGGVHSILYWLDRNDPRGPAPRNPESDPQFSLWEPKVRQWAEINAQNVREPIIPTEFDDIHNPDSFPTMEIISPNLDEEYNNRTRINVAFETRSLYEVTRADYFVNDQLIGNSIRPHSFSFVPNDIQSIRRGSNNSLRVVIYDSVLNRTEQTVNFFVN